MAGSPTLRPRAGGFVAALAVAILTYTDLARAQDPPPPAAAPVEGLSSYIEAEDLQSGMTAPPLVPRPSYYYPGMIPSGTRVELGLFDTITESIFGQPDPDTWRPLPLGTLFSEGWNEAWVPSPNGSGGAPAGLDQCPGRQPLPAVVLHVRPGIQQ